MGYMQKLFYHKNRLLQSIWQRIKTFLLICTFNIQFCCSSSTIKNHKISLHSVITIYTLCTECTNKKVWMWKYAYSIIIVVCQGKQSFFRFVSLYFSISRERKINSLRDSFNDFGLMAVVIMRFTVHIHLEPFAGVIIFISVG